MNRSFIIYVLVVLSLFPQPGTATLPYDTLELNFHLQVSERDLVLDTLKYSYQDGTDSFSIAAFKAYITNIKLKKGASIVWEELSTYHLIDAAEPATLNIKAPFPEAISFDNIEFTLGVDSTTNAKGVGGGHLDPSKGMYWAWQSGYINLKLEGTSKLCPTRKNAFHYHLGGFMDGNACAQTVSLPATKKELTIITDLGLLLNMVNLADTPSVMVPGKTAIQLSKHAAKIFHIAR